MEGNEAVIGRLDEDGKAVVKKHTLGSYFVTDILESERQKTLTNTSFVQNDTGSVLEFTKPLVDGLGGRHDIDGNGTNRFIWAVGKDHNLRYHRAFGSLQLTLKPCTEVTSDDDLGDGIVVGKTITYEKLFFLHGLLAIVVFGVFMPVAISASRARSLLQYEFRSKRIWYVVHSYLNTLGYILTLVLVGLVVYAYHQKKKEHFGAGESSSNHEVVGLVTVLLMSVQVVGGVLRPDAHKKPQDVPVCESLVEVLIPMQNQRQNSLDLALVENDEKKEKQEEKNGDRDEKFTSPTQHVPICDNLVAALIPMQNQEQNVLWEEDSLDLDLDKNNEEKGKKGVENGFQSESLTGTLENVVNTNKNKNAESLVSPPPKNVSVCESSVVETTIMQDQKQNVLWEEDSLDLDLDENNQEEERKEAENSECEYNNLTGTLQQVVNTSKENTEFLVSPYQDVPVCKRLVAATISAQDQEENELWEVDSLDLDLEKNNGEKVIEEVENGDRHNENLTQTLGNIVDSSKEKKSETLISPPQDAPVFENSVTALTSTQKKDHSLNSNAPLASLPLTSTLFGLTPLLSPELSPKKVKNSITITEPINYQKSTLGHCKEIENHSLDLKHSFKDSNIGQTIKSEYSNEKHEISLVLESYPDETWRVNSGNNNNDHFAINDINLTNNDDVVDVPAIDTENSSTTEDDVVDVPKVRFVRTVWQKCHVVMGIATFGCGLYQLHTGLILYETLFQSRSYVGMLWGCLGGLFGLLGGMIWYSKWVT